MTLPPTIPATHDPETITVDWDTISTAAWALTHRLTDYARLGLTAGMPRMYRAARQLGQDPETLQAFINLGLAQAAKGESWETEPLPF